MSYFGYWISSVFSQQKEEIIWTRSGCRDRWLWVGLTQHKQTHGDLVKPQLWNVHTVEFLHVTGCGLDIRVQGHFLKCAPPPDPPPSHFLHTQTKAASLGKVLGHLCLCVEPKPACRQILWSPACLYTRYRALGLQPDGMRDNCLICSK